MASARASLLRRFIDAYAGKKAKLADSALRNRAGQFVRYGKADWSFAGLNITLPPSAGDWSKFNMTNLEGDKTYPVVTTTILATNSDLTGRGAPRCCWLQPCANPPSMVLHAPCRWGKRMLAWDRMLQAGCHGCVSGIGHVLFWARSSCERGLPSPQTSTLNTLLWAARRGEGCCAEGGLRVPVRACRPGRRPLVRTVRAESPGEARP